MTRRRALVLLGLVLPAAAAAFAGSSPAAPQPRQLSFGTSPSLDYAGAIPAPGGGAATLAPLDASAIHASGDDLAYLRYRNVGDWGGFLSAPVGRLALGRTAGSVRSFAFLHTQKKARPDHGRSPIAPRPPRPLPTPTRQPKPQPRANGCFSGCTKPLRHERRPRPLLGGAGNCGTAGLSITISLRHCRIHVVNRRPGQSAVERVTIKNTSSSRYVVSFRAAGKWNRLWRDMQLGIWRRGSRRPTELPQLDRWTKRFRALATLAPGKSLRLTIEMRLAASAGLGDQHQQCVVGFLWRASGTPKP